jgi:hypothetical protein
LAAIGQAVSEAGDVAGHLFEQEMSARVSGALGMATRELNDLSLEVDKAPDHNTRNDIYAKGSSKIAAKFRESIGSPKFQQDFDLRFEGTLEHGRMKVAHGVRQSQVASSAANRLMFIEGKLDSIEDEANPALRQQAIEEIYREADKGVEGGLWSDEKATAIKIGATNRMEQSALLVKAQTISDELRVSIPDPQRRVAAARNRHTGKLRTAVVSIVEHQIDTDRTLSTRARADARKDFYREVKARKHADGTPVTVKSILAASARLDFTQEETEALLALITPTSTEVGNARKLASRSLFEQLRGQALSVGPAQKEFFRRDFFDAAGPDGELGTEDDTTPLYTMLEEPHLNKLLEIQQGGPTSKYVIHGTRSNAVRDQLLVELDMDWTPAQLSSKGAVDLQKRQQLIEAFEDFILAKQQKENREWLYPQEMRDIARDLKREVTLDTDWLDTTARVYQITPELLEEELGAMPADVEADIRRRKLEPAIAERLERPTIGDASDMESLKLLHSIWKSDLLARRGGSAL